MGIWLEIHPADTVRITKQDLKDRLVKIGLKPHPEAEAEEEYLLRGGVLRISREESFKKGVWAHARLSSAADEADWLDLLTVAERIGGRVYDDDFGHYWRLEDVGKLVGARRKDQDVTSKLIGTVASGKTVTGAD